MSKLAIKKGATSNRLYVFLQDSSVTTGAGKTGLVFNSAGVSSYYVRPGAAAASISVITQTVTGAYSSGGFVEVDATNMPGVYRFDVPDAAFATGVNSVLIMLRFTGIAPCVIECQLMDYDPQDAVRLGLTALPNATAGAASGLPVLDAQAKLSAQPYIVRGPNTAQAGATTSITLDAGASGTSGFYADCWVEIVAGTGAGQTRLITAYNGTTKIALIAPDYATAPDNTSVFYLLASTWVDVGMWISNSVTSNVPGLPSVDVVDWKGGAVPTPNVTGEPLVDVNHWRGAVPNILQSGRVDSYLGAILGGVITSGSFAANALGAVWDELRSGHTIAGSYGQAGQVVRATNTAQAGAATTITLDGGASASDNYYNGCIVLIGAGTGSGQFRTITGYVGATRVATVSPSWAINPDNTSIFVVLGQ